MRKVELITKISDKTGIAKVDVLVTLETMFTEIKKSIIVGENIYIRGFGSFIAKKRAKLEGRDSIPSDVQPAELREFHT